MMTSTVRSGQNALLSQSSRGRAAAAAASAAASGGSGGGGGLWGSLSGVLFSRAGEGSGGWGKRGGPAAEAAIGALAEVRGGVVCYTFDTCPLER